MIDSLRPADPLGEVLHLLRMSGTMYSRCDFAAPWALALPPLPGSLMFHVVTSGRCWLKVDGGEERLLGVGDLALVPHGDGHRLASEPGVAAVGLWDLPRQLVSDRSEILRIDGGGAVTTLICGTVRFDHPAAHHLIGVLPRTIVVEAVRSNHAEWLLGTIRLMGAEASDLRPGGETLITRLADVLVIQAIRAWIDRDPEGQTGWLGALRDRQIGRALVLIHRDPAREWSVGRLAYEVAMSRSAFAARFAALVGEPPMRYLARWRMRVAAAALREGDAALGELAIRLGYRSEAAFSRAFKREIGVAPGSLKRGEVPSPVREPVAAA